MLPVRHRVDKQLEEMTKSINTTSMYETNDFDIVLSLLFNQKNVRKVCRINRHNFQL